MLTVAISLVLAQTKSPPKLPTSQEIVKKVRAAVRAASPIKGTLQITGPTGQKSVLNFCAMYPGLFSSRITLFGTTSEAHWTKSAFISYLPDTKVYTKLPRPTNAEEVDPGLLGLESLFNDHNYFKGLGTAKSIQFNGKAAFSIPIERGFAQRAESRRFVLFVDAKTFLPLGFDEDQATARDRATYTSLTSRAKMTPKDFEWTPPKDAVSATKG